MGEQTFCKDDSQNSCENTQAAELYSMLKLIYVIEKNNTVLVSKSNYTIHMILYFLA